MIHENAGELAMAEELAARRQTLSDHGRQRVLAGETSIEEVLRVTAAS